MSRRFASGRSDALGILVRVPVVGTAVTLRLTIGFTLTVATIWLIPALVAAVGWSAAFAFLAPGPALGVLAMLRLKASPDAARIAGGAG